MKFTTAYGPKNPYNLDTGSQSFVQQSDKDECDINLIMQRYQKTGLLEHVRTYQGQYGDFTRIGSYHEMMNAALEAENMFMSLPAQMRDQFANDPGLFLEWVSDPQNRAQMAEIGLLDTQAPENSTPVEASSEASSDSVEASPAPALDPKPLD